MPGGFWLGLAMFLVGMIGYSIVQDYINAWLDRHDGSIAGPRVRIKLVRLIYMVTDLFRALRYVSLRRKQGQSAVAALALWLLFALMVGGLVVCVRALQEA